MAISLRFQLPAIVVLALLVSLFISAASASDGSPAPSISPTSAVFHTPTHTYPPALFATILSTLGFQELSSATVNANISATTPLTIFAASDASLLTCPSCSLPLLLQELSIPGLYPHHFLLTLTFGTKIETIAPNRCLTITSNSKGKVFVNGVEITSPDVFNNGLVVIHGLQGFVSHLSPLSCNVERMTSLSFPSPSLSSVTSPPPSLFLMRLMLKDAIIRLRATGYSVVSLAMRVKYAELTELKAMTVFAIDDTAIFSGGGNVYLSNFRFHVVPNKRLAAAELVTLPASTSLPTLDATNNLVVTTAGGGGPSVPMKINYVKITTIDLLHNSRIVIHGLSAPFPHMMHQPYMTSLSFPSTSLSSVTSPPPPSPSHAAAALRTGRFSIAIAGNVISIVMFAWPANPLGLFSYWANKKNRIIILSFLLGAIILLVVVVLITNFCTDSHATRTMVVGILAAISGVIMYASPLLVMGEVMSSNNPDMIHLDFCLIATFNAILWFTYAFVGRTDAYVAVPNGIGACVGIFQLAVKAYYTYKAKVVVEV